jgi:hypothetical protein
MTTSQTPGPADVRGEAPAGSGTNFPVVPGGTSRTPGSAAAHGGAAREALGVVVPPTLQGGADFQLPQRTRQPRREPGCTCHMCKPKWTG